MGPKDTEPRDRQRPHVLSCRLNETNDKGYIAHETAGQLQEDLHKFRRRCETYKALAVAIAEDDRPLAGRRAARLLQASWAPAKVLGHLCDAWSVQSWHAQNRDAAALAAFGVGGPKPLQALNNAGYLLSYDTGRRHVEGAPRFRPNELPSLPWLLEALGHIPGCQAWHLCIEKSMWRTSSLSLARHSLLDFALRVAGTPCRSLVVLMLRLWHNGRSRIQIHTTPPTRRRWCFLLLIQMRGALPSLSGIPIRGRFKAEHCHAVRKHMAELCGNAAFRESHGFLLYADTDGDARRPREMQGAPYADGASTLSWMPEIPHIPFQADEFRMCGNFDPPPNLMKRVSHPFGGTSLIFRGELSYGVLQERHNHCDDPKLVLPPLPPDEQEFEPAFDIL